MRSIRWFSEIGLDAVDSVGGKGASLGEATRAGIRVPPGFVVTTAAFEQHVGGLASVRETVRGLDHRDLAAVAKATARARELIQGAPLPRDLYADLARDYGHLAGADAMAPVAVRSSATSEDSAEASFAGLQDTYLWVKGVDAAVDAVRRCWASLYSDASVVYRLRLGLPEEQVAMGVVVQKMVDARCAGVMFTRSPTTGDRSVVAVSCSWGLGSAVVSGEVTPDEYTINKVTGEVVKRAVSAKTCRHVPEPAGGVRSEEVPAPMQGVPCVSDDELRDLAALGCAIERHYGRPQDIEWAIEQSGELFVLQSRPETVWGARDAQPLAQPRSNPFEHVLAALGGTRR